MINGDVITMAQSGLAEATIRLSVDAAAETNFDTSAAALAGLSQVGVPELVIQAMIGRASGAAPQPSAAPAAPASARFALTPRRVSVLPSTIKPVIGGTYFTRYNFWYESREHVTTNYSRGVFVPINTRVKLISSNARRMRLGLPSEEIVDIEWVPEFTLRPLADIASELLGDVLQHGSQTVILLCYREKMIANREVSLVACEIAETVGPLAVPRSRIQVVAHNPTRLPQFRPICERGS